MSDKVLLSAKELASALNVSRTWVYESTKAGSVPFYSMGGVKRYRLDEVLAAMRVEVKS